jgi:hypothetical protein
MKSKVKPNKVTHLVVGNQSTPTLKNLRRKKQESARDRRRALS